MSEDTPASNHSSSAEALFDSPIVKVALLPALVLAVGAWVNITVTTSVAPIRETLATISATVTRISSDVEKLSRSNDSALDKIHALEVQIAIVQQSIGKTGK